MLVSSAASRTGSRPASTAATTPMIQVARCGTWRRGCRAPNQRGIRPSRLIAYQSREAPIMNEKLTVTMPSTAPIAITVPTPPRPTASNAAEKPRAGSTWV